MKKMFEFMKKTIFAIAVVLAVFSFLPETTEAATIKLNRKQVTATAKECFTFKVSGAKGRKVEWFSTKKSVATVSKKGVVVTKKAGKATIKAKVGSKTVKCKVTVKKNASQPWLTAKTKTLHVGESFLLIEGWFTDYESVFSFNDRIATADGSGRVTATGVGTVKIMVNRGMVGKEYRDYFCTVTVVPGAAKTCKHNWMDARDKSGDLLGIKEYREEAYNECITCGAKFFDEKDMFKHREETGMTHSGSRTAGGGKTIDAVKFTNPTHTSYANQYCRDCGLTK